MTKSTSTHEAISYAVKNTINGSKRAGVIVLLNLLLTVFNLEN